MTAGIELRERFAFADAEIPALQRLADLASPSLDQAAILATFGELHHLRGEGSVPAV